MYDGSQRTYFNNDTVEALIRSIYARCGLHGASSLSIRTTKILGHADVQVTLEYIDISEKQIERLFELAF